MASITRRFGAAAAGALLTAGALAAAQEPADRNALAAFLVEAPAYVRLFVHTAARDASRAFVSPLDIDALLRTLEPDPALLRPPGSWRAEAMSPADAFGGTGATDRWRVARLYGGRRPRVARGPRADAGRVIESWTLVSPYPHHSLERLESGTLILVLRIPPVY